MGPIYDYFDYREILTAWLEAPERRTSLRGLAAKLGCSPSFLSQVRTGKRSLDLTMARPLAAAMDFTGAEADYFEALVRLDEAPTRKLQHQGWEDASRLRRLYRAGAIEGDDYELFSWWLPSALVELSRCGPLGEPSSLARRFRLPAHPDEVERALSFLQHRGFLTAGPDGQLAPAQEAWTTGHQAAGARSEAADRRRRGLALVALYQQMLQHAADALLEVPAADRQFGMLTFAVASERYPELRERIGRFQDEILSWAAEGADDPDRVVHLGIQLFPLTSD